MVESCLVLASKGGGGGCKCCRGGGVDRGAGGRRCNEEPHEVDPMATKSAIPSIARACPRGRLPTPVDGESADRVTILVTADCAYRSPHRVTISLVM